jgi:hypothetical protein
MPDTTDTLSLQCATTISGSRSLSDGLGEDLEDHADAVKRPPGAKNRHPVNGVSSSTTDNIGTSG